MSEILNELLLAKFIKFVIYIYNHDISIVKTLKKKKIINNHLKYSVSYFLLFYILKILALNFCSRFPKISFF